MTYVTNLEIHGRKIHISTLQGVMGLAGRKLLNDVLVKELRKMTADEVALLDEQDNGRLSRRACMLHDRLDKAVQTFNQRSCGGRRGDFEPISDIKIVG